MAAQGQRKAGWTWGGLVCAGSRGEHAVQPRKAGRAWEHDSFLHDHEAYPCHIAQVTCPESSPAPFLASS
jgi:hypothetical protein